MTAAAPPTALWGAPAGWRLLVHDSLPSTSDALIGLAEAGEPDGLAVLARRQTAGRGRDGRAWASPTGNLHLSVLLRPPGPARDSLQWPLLAGVALAEAAAELDPEPAALRLKWPNDLLRRGAKAAGILAESALAPSRGGEPPRLAWLVLGFGANLGGDAPAVPGRPTAALPTTTPAEDLALRLLRRLEHWRAVHTGRGFAPVREAWRALGPAIGEPMTARLHDGPLPGRFAGLAEDGGLLLDTADGRRHILAGEVTAGGAPAPAGDGSG